jgi:hypothetical protein
MHDRVQFRVDSRLAKPGPHSNLAADRIELEDLHFLVSAHFQKVGSDLVLSDDHGQKLVLPNSASQSTPTSFLTGQLFLGIWLFGSLELRRFITLRRERRREPR